MKNIIIVVLVLAVIFALLYFYGKTLMNAFDENQKTERLKDIEKTITVLNAENKMKPVVRETVIIPLSYNMTNDSLEQKTKYETGERIYMTNDSL